MRLGLRAIWTCLTVGALGGVLGSACSPSSDVPAGHQGGAGGGGIGGFDPGTSGAGVGGDDGGLNPDSACASIKAAAKATPLDLYIMFDKSQSMVGDKWNSAKAGLQKFVNDPYTAGIRVGLRFFPRDPDATPACDQAAYKPPLVPFAELPMNAPAIVAAMNAESPDGFTTPMYPALGGAILEGIEIAQNDPSATAAVLLVTDGQPQGPAAMCGSVDPEDPNVVADLAAKGAAWKPPVLTYVIGLPGVDQAIANQIAMAGGTGAAILVGATNVEAEFEKALSNVLGQALPCEFVIPDKVQSGEFAIDKVNVEVTSGTGDSTTIPQNATCNGEGWKYDDPAAPKLIVLCPASCQALKKDFKATIEILLGCTTIIN